MENIQDFLLKLHYLDLEVHERYQIINRLSLTDELNISIIKNVLGPLFKQYEALDISKLKEELSKEKIGFLTIFDEAYPEKLKVIYHAPLLLFYQGDINLLKRKILAVIGARKYSPYGEKVTKYLIPDLVKEGIVIISGLAYGIDTIAHKTTIDHGGKTIAVLGSGISNIYPPEHEELGRLIGKEYLLLSEYYPHAKPYKTHFPFRNRIVGALSDGVLVIEAKERSGTLITCDYALEQGKDIFAVPNDIFDTNSIGTNNLIKEGAYLVTNASDILSRVL